MLSLVKTTMRQNENLVGVQDGKLYKREGHQLHIKVGQRNLIYRPPKFAFISDLVEDVHGKIYHQVLQETFDPFNILYMC